MSPEEARRLKAGDQVIIVDGCDVNRSFFKADGKKGSDRPWRAGLIYTVSKIWKTSAVLIQVNTPNGWICIWPNVAAVYSRKS